MGKLIHGFQLADHLTGESIIAAGGLIVVCAAGSTKRLALTDPASGAAILQPVPLVRGFARFAVEDTVNQVDIYGVAPGGQAFQVKSVSAQAKNEYFLDTGRTDHTLVIPFHAEDTGENVEWDSGFDLPMPAFFLPQGLGVYVQDVDAAETIDVGTDSGDGGDADGFMDGIGLSIAGLAKPTLSSSGQTLGALLRMDESGAGALVPEAMVSNGKSITMTLSAGSDTAAGLVILPYRLVTA